MSSLRERTRRRNTEAVQRVAVELVHERGLDHVTAEMIAEGAGISARTFFNYFPYKEAALLPQRPEFSDLARQAFADGQGSLLDDLVGFLDTVFEDFPYDRGFMVKMHDVAAQNPRIMALHQGVFQEFEDELAELVRFRLSPDQKHQAELLSMLLSTAIRHGLKIWAHSVTGTPALHVRTALNDMTTLAADITRTPVERDPPRAVANQC